MAKKKIKKKTAKPKVAIRVKFFSLVSDEGDGSHSVLFFKNRKNAENRCDEDEEQDGYVTGEVNEEVLEFDENGILLNGNDKEEGKDSADDE